MKQCRTCGCTDVWVELTPDGPHHGKVRCVDCQSFIAWQPKPRKPLTVGGKALYRGDEYVVIAMPGNSPYMHLQTKDGRKLSVRREGVKGEPA